MNTEIVFKSNLIVLGLVNNNNTGLNNIKKQLFLLT